MSGQPRVLILTAQTGGGHLSLADALRDMLEPHYAVTIVEMLPAFFAAAYRFEGRHARWLWRTQFHLTNTPHMAPATHRLLIPLLSPRWKEIVEQHQPHLVITTHPQLSYAVKHALEKDSPGTPLVMLFSDPARVHMSWFSEHHAQASLAPTHELYQQALEAGFDPQRLYLVGWPVREQFYHAHQWKREEILNRIHLDPRRFTIFLQGGGDGATPFWCSARHLLAVESEVQIILAAGTNRALRRRFEGVKNLYVLPFTSQIAPYMAAADVIMGKAGPNVLNESVVLDKPFLATTCLSGQEEGRDHTGVVATQACPSSMSSSCQTVRSGWLRIERTHSSFLSCWQKEFHECYVRLQDVNHL